MSDTTLKAQLASMIIELRTADDERCDYLLAQIGTGDYEHIFQQHPELRKAFDRALAAIFDDTDSD